MGGEKDLRVVVVGAGFSGIAQAIRLVDTAGIPRSKITILERASEVGGVWRDSKWPGASVDVPVHQYQLSSDLFPDWERAFASQPEVLSYLKQLVKKHKLEGRILFNTSFVSSRWSASTQSHTIEISTGDKVTSIEAEILISASGPLSLPRKPDIKGIDTFEGRSFHNLQWDESVPLAGKRIAVIGNGSSAVQFIPGLSQLPGSTIHQFIRTGGFYLPRVNSEFSPAWKFAFKWIPGLQWLYRLRLFLKTDYAWWLRNRVTNKGYREREAELRGYLKARAPEKYFDILNPSYPFGCKRPATDVGWLASLHRPNVTLTATPISRITPTGLVLSDGVEHQFDVLIFATGSSVASGGVGLCSNVFGEDGQELEAVWKKQGGPEAYIGVAVPSFPNYFVVLGPNAVANTWGFSLGNQSTFIARLIKGMRRNKLSSLAVSEQAAASYNAHLRSALKGTTLDSSSCSSWWKTADDGKITVPFFGPGLTLWWWTRKIEWGDWITKRGEKQVRAGDGLPGWLWGLGLVGGAFLAATAVLGGQTELVRLIEGLRIR